MHIVLLHDSVTAADAADAQDVLVQAEAISQALAYLGHSCHSHACGLNLEGVMAVLREQQAGLVFNLVESLAGQGRLIHLLPTCLEAAAIPFTGSSATALLLSSNKILAKKRLQQAGIATPAWYEATEGKTSTNQELDGRWMIKSVWEHASIGMDASSVQRPSSMAALQEILRERRHRPGGPFFAEAYIEGREFNVSLLDSGEDTDGADGGGEVEVLPVAEIVFDDFPPDQPKIVDYAAKWEQDSFTCRHTRRVFPGDEDEALLAELRILARQCRHALQLSGYARVDFRVDHAGRPWVLEVNANPCLAPDAGFAAALHQAGIAYHEAIGRIIQAALAQKP